MKLIYTFLISILYTFQVFAQSNQTWAEAVKTGNATLNVQYFDNFPFSYHRSKMELVGIEVDLVNEFIKWAKDQKNVSLTANFIENKDFYSFYDEVKKSSGNLVGIGSVTISSVRMAEVNFSAPYLKNKSLLISSINVPTITNMADVTKNFDSLIAIVVKGSIHEQEVLALKSKYLPKLKIEYVSSPRQVLEKMRNSGKYFSYIDLVSYWAFVKQPKSKYMKIHRVANSNEELFGAVFPKNSDWNIAFNEFMESGLGFVASEDYKEVLRKNLGEEIIRSVSVSNIE